MPNEQCNEGNNEQCNNEQCNNEQCNNEQCNEGNYSDIVTITLVVVEALKIYFVNFFMVDRFFFYFLV